MQNMTSNSSKSVGNNPTKVIKKNDVDLIYFKNEWSL